MADYIERDKVLALEVFMQDADGFDCSVVLSADIRRCCAADVVEVEPELRKAVKLLHEKYKKAKQAPFARDPLAYALYKTWKAVEEERVATT